MTANTRIDPQIDNSLSQSDGDEQPLRQMPLFRMVVPMTMHQTAEGIIEQDLLVMSDTVRRVETGLIFKGTVRPDALTQLHTVDIDSLYC
jgi:hypothetical protein